MTRKQAQERIAKASKLATQIQKQNGTKLIPAKKVYNTTRQKAMAQAYKTLYGK